LLILPTFASFGVEHTGRRYGNRRAAQTRARTTPCGSYQAGMKSILQSIRARRRDHQGSIAREVHAGVIGVARPDGNHDAALASGIVELVDMLASVRIEVGSIAARARPAVEPPELQRALAELDRAISATKELAARVDPIAGPQREQ